MPVAIVLERVNIYEQFEINHGRFCNHLHLVVHLKAGHVIQHLPHMADVVSFEASGECSNVEMHRHMERREVLHPARSDAHRVTGVDASKPVPVSACRYSHVKIVGHIIVAAPFCNFWN